MTDKEQLSEAQAHLKNIEEKNAKLFEELGLSSHQLHHFIHDPERFPVEAKEEIDRQSHELEMILHRKIEETKTSLRERSPFKLSRSPLEEKSGGHWILMK